jgi:hypothetical protein
MNVKPRISEHWMLKITPMYVLIITVEFCNHKTFVMDRKTSKYLFFMTRSHPDSSPRHTYKADGKDIRPQTVQTHNEGISTEFKLVTA